MQTSPDSNHPAQLLKRSFSADRIASASRFASVAIPILVSHRYLRVACQNTPIAPGARGLKRLPTILRWRFARSQGREHERAAAPGSDAWGVPVLFHPSCLIISDYMTRLNNALRRRGKRGPSAEVLQSGMKRCASMGMPAYRHAQGYRLTERYPRAAIDDSRSDG